MKFKLDSEKTREELLTLVRGLRDQVDFLQKRGAKLWEERNAAVDGGWFAVKSLYASAQAKENDRLRSKLLITERRLTVLLTQEPPLP